MSMFNKFLFLLYQAGESLILSPTLSFLSFFRTLNMHDIETNNLIAPILFQWKFSDICKTEQYVLKDFNWQTTFYIHLNLKTYI